MMMAASRTSRDKVFSGDRKAAWEGFLHCQAALIHQLADDLDDAGEIPLSTYDILVQLSEAGGRLRLRDLVDRVVLSQPGLSRKVARLEEDGLLDRLPDPTDGRGVLVRISRSGRSALRSAANLHVAGIERMFAARIDDDEAATLARVFARLLAEQDLAAKAAGSSEPGAGNGGMVSTATGARSTGRRAGSQQTAAGAGARSTKR